MAIVRSKAPGEAYQLIAAALIDENSFYSRLASDLINKTPRSKARRSKGHGLCRQLDAVAKAISPGTYTDKLGGIVAEELKRLGAPSFFARAGGASAGIGAKLAMSHIPVGQAATALLALIPLVCPDLEACPTRERVINAYAGATVAHQLQAFEQSTEHILLSGHP